MEVFTELVKILSEDRVLVQNKGRFMGSLGLSEATAIYPWLKMFNNGDCTPYDLIKIILTEWIAIKKESATIAELRRILQQEDFQRCSRNLEKLQEMHPGVIIIPGLETSRRNDPFGISPQPHSSENPPPMENTTRQITFGLKSVVQNFTGREEELARLNEYFHSKECPIVLVSGLGGIGKTELAKKFALDITDIQIVKCWLSGENPQSLLNSTAKFCEQLRLPSKGADGQPLPIQEMIQNIMDKLKSSEEIGRWVVIIDNVDDIHEQFEATVQSLSEFGSDAFLLITSRRMDIFPGELELLELTKMQLTDSMAFVRKSLKITDDSLENYIKSLCLKLDNFPLALNQSVAFIRQQQTITLKREANSIRDYLYELTINQKLGLDRNRKLGYSIATLAVWNITIDKIRQDYGTEGRLALDLLDAMAFINADDISIPFLHIIYQKFYNIEEKDPSKIKDSLTLLLKYSFISSYDEVLNIHRLVQLSLRDRMSKSPADGKSSKHVQMLVEFWSTFDSKEWKRIMPTIDMRKVLRIWNQNAPQKYMSLYGELLHFGMIHGSFDFAIDGRKFLLQTRNYEEYSREIHSTSLQLVGKEEHESALPKFTALYSKLKEQRGAEDNWTLSEGYRIANVLYFLERLEDSLKWGQRVLQSQIKINGDKNERVMKTKKLVAMTLKKLGMKKEAMEIYSEVLQWEEAKFQDKHLSTFETRVNIAMYFYDMGNFTTAYVIFLGLLSLYEKYLGAHPNTFSAKYCVADALFQMGKTDRALKLWEEVLVASEKVLWAEHPKTINVREKIAFFKNYININQEKNS